MVKWARRDDMDTRPSLPPEPRLEWLREMVDDLPKDQQLVLSRLYFGAGSPTFAELEDELGMKASAIKEILRRGLETIRTKVLEKDEMGPVSTTYET
jgi:DNA-directed RNA polymerase specialized sigma24 family protein